MNAHLNERQAERSAGELVGRQLLREPLRNQDLAFSPLDRDAWGLRGLLPAANHSLAQQTELEWERLGQRAAPLDKYIDLAELHDRNEVLYYRLLVDHLAELLPIVYTPTVGLACQHYSRVMRRPRGLWITPQDRGRIGELLRNASRGPEPRPVKLMVVTDNQRILGLGDLGAGGMGIPIGKLTLYTAAAGVPPEFCLPVSLDVGTDNPQLLEDPLYCGYRQPRLRGPAYWALLDEFVDAVRDQFPGCVVQWEDFLKENAFAVLDRYREAVPSFNDDIQGTAAVVLGGLLAGLRITGGQLIDQRIVLAGAGAAGGGIGRLIRAAWREAGATPEQLARGLVYFDRQGLVYEGREIAEAHKRELALPADALRHYQLADPGSVTLTELVRAVKPHVVIGSTAQPGLFDQSLVETLAAHTPRPLIFPLSNPGTKVECAPSDALGWSRGRALVATGTAFPPVVDADGQPHLFGQANNVFVFPGVGLACLLAGAATIPQQVFLAAAKALAATVSPSRLAHGALYPDQSELRHVSREIAVAALQELQDAAQPRSPEQLRALVDHAMWEPAYD